LSRAGASVALIEARSRLGGRIWTRRRPGWPVPLELGPEFIHGRDAKFFALLEEAGMRAIRLPDAHVRRVASELRPLTDLWDQFEAMTRRIGRAGRDRSVAEELRRRRAAFTSEQRRLLIMMVEGYDAAPADLASAQALSTAGERPAGDDDRAQFRPIEGYGRLVDRLLTRVDGSRCTLLRSTVVRSVVWRRGAVRMATTRGEIRARRALVTAPIGVLRAPAGSRGAIAFDPDPPALRRALSGLAMGDVVRLVLRFRDPFWREAPLVARVRRSGEADPNFFHFFGAVFPTWWTCAPVEGAVLTAWAGGEAASTLRSLPRGQIVRTAVETFAAGIGVPARRVARKLLAWDLHDWTADPYSRGAYSYALVGGATAGHRLMRPIEDTLFFAGEAVGEGDSGTVPAAVASGERAARRMLR
jgi:monoamine oxidase